MRKRAFRLSLLAALLVFMSGDVAFLTPQSAATPRRAHKVPVSTGAFLLPRILEARRETWRWQELMGIRPTRSVQAAEQARSLAYRRWVLHLWRRRARRASYRAHHFPRLQAWLCIHRYEGAWNDPNPPYYGGLQMDIGFQRLYGGDLLRRKGTADRWTPLEQMWVAERAYRSGRGFYPWPNTARYCGLI